MTAKVLVVDADPSNCGTWETILVAQGYGVSVARGGDVALRFVLIFNLIWSC